MLLILGAFVAISALRLMKTPNLDDAMILTITLLGTVVAAYAVALRMVRPYRDNAAEVNNG